MGKSEILNFFNNYWGIFLVLIYLINIVLVIYFNPMNVVSNYTRITTFFILFAGFFNLILFYYFNYNQKSVSSDVLGYLYIFGKYISIAVVFYGLIYAIFYYVVFTPWPLTIIATILNALIIIGLVALAYKFIGAKAKSSLPEPKSKTAKILDLLKQIILYIPCLLIDLVNYIKHQYNITTKTEWIILLIEIVLIGLRFALPYFYSLLHNTGGKLVAQGPFYLNNAKDLGVFQNKKQPVSASKKLDFNYNYAISTWLWINPQPDSTSDAYSRSTSLLNYGDILKINYDKNKVVILASSTENTDESEMGPNETVKIIDIKNFPYQKWNNIVMNYDGGTLDIFINNHLVASTINITPVLYNSKVVSGSKDGIHGGIRDLVYYDKVLNKNDIYSIYTMG